MKTLVLKTTAGGKFDPQELLKALDDHGPFEPRTEYTLSLDVTVGGLPGAADLVAGTGTSEPTAPPAPPVNQVIDDAPPAAPPTE